MKPINRVHEIIKYKRISISAFEKKTGMSNNSIQVALKKEARLKDETLNSILNTYPDISPEWLLTGKGKMFRPVGTKEDAPQSLAEPQAVHGKPHEVIYAGSCSSCQEKEKVIQGLENQLEEVRYRLADKDKQIEDLKNNLGMVISEKTEVVKMKDEMLTMKNHMLEMQAKRIAELEEYNQTQTEKAGKQKSA